MYVSVMYPITARMAGEINGLIAKIKSGRISEQEARMQAQKFAKKVPTSQGLIIELQTVAQQKGIADILNPEAISTSEAKTVAPASPVIAQPMPTAPQPIHAEPVQIPKTIEPESKQEPKQAIKPAEVKGIEQKPKPMLVPSAIPTKKEQPEVPTAQVKKPQEEEPSIQKTAHVSATEIQKIIQGIDDLYAKIWDFMPDQLETAFNNLFKPEILVVDFSDYLPPASLKHLWFIINHIEDSKEYVKTIEDLHFIARGLFKEYNHTMGFGEGIRYIDALTNIINEITYSNTMGIPSTSKLAGRTQEIIDDIERYIKTIEEYAIQAEEIIPLDIPSDVGLTKARETLNMLYTKNQYMQYEPKALEDAVIQLTLYAKQLKPEEQKKINTIDLFYIALHEADTTLTRIEQKIQTIDLQSIRNLFASGFVDEGLAAVNKKAAYIDKLQKKLSVIVSNANLKVNKYIMVHAGIIQEQLEKKDTALIQLVQGTIERDIKHTDAFITQAQKMPAQVDRAAILQQITEAIEEEEIIDRLFTEPQAKANKEIIQKEEALLFDIAKQQSMQKVGKPITLQSFMDQAKRIDVQAKKPAKNIKTTQASYAKTIDDLYKIHTQMKTEDLKVAFDKLNTLFKNVLVPPGSEQKYDSIQEAITIGNTLKTIGVQVKTLSQQSKQITKASDASRIIATAYDLKNEIAKLQIKAYIADETVIGTLIKLLHKAIDEILETTSGWTAIEQKKLQTVVVTTDDTKEQRKKRYDAFVAGINDLYKEYLYLKPAEIRKRYDQLHAALTSALFPASTKLTPGQESIQKEEKQAIQKAEIAVEQKIKDIFRVEALGLIVADLVVQAKHAVDKVKTIQNTIGASEHRHLLRSIQKQAQEINIAGYPADSDIAQQIATINSTIEQALSELETKFMSKIMPIPSQPSGQTGPIQITQAQVEEQSKKLKPISIPEKSKVPEKVSAQILQTGKVGLRHNVRAQEMEKLIQELFAIDTQTGQPMYLGLDRDVLEEHLSILEKKFSDVSIDTLSETSKAQLKTMKEYIQSKKAPTKSMPTIRPLETIVAQLFALHATIMPIKRILSTDYNAYDTEFKMLNKELEAYTQPQLDMVLKTREQKREFETIRAEIESKLDWFVEKDKIDYGTTAQAKSIPNDTIYSHLDSIQRNLQKRVSTQILRNNIQQYFSEIDTKYINPSDYAPFVQWDSSKKDALKDILYETIRALIATDLITQKPVSELSSIAQAIQFIDHNARTYIEDYMIQKISVQAMRDAIDLQAEAAYRLPLAEE